MPIFFIGNALNTKPDGTTGWFPRAIIPVSSIEKIPNTFIKRSGGFRSETINLSPKPANVGTFATEAPSPEEFPFPKFTWKNIVLTNFQLDLYYMLEEMADGKPVNLLNMPKYTDVYRDSQWEVKTEGAINHKKRTNNKRFVVEKLYLCASEEFYEWTKNNNKEVTEEGTTESDLAYGSQSRSKVNPYNVWYALGNFLIDAETSTGTFQAGFGKQLRSEQELSIISEEQFDKPVALSITRDKEDFTKAYVYGEQLMTINEGQYSSDINLKVKFVFDNGIEKYAEVIEIPGEFAITSSAEASRDFEIASNVPDGLRNLEPPDGVINNAPDVSANNITTQFFSDIEDIDIDRLESTAQNFSSVEQNVINLAGNTLKIRR